MVRSQPAQGVQLLVVDGSPALREAVCVRLRQPHWQVIEAGDRTAALEHIERDRPSIVLLAADWPDGLPTAWVRALRAVPATRNLPLVVYTRTADGPARAALLDAGADDAAQLTVSGVELVARLRALLRRCGRGD